ncbi:hypothetical protein DPMN_078286 [Dreissena polymorpha]|uniref:Uncharacterized protein n=1 Tax=Dreissena polymorpha TaxID=45954 RepID=A0A9D3YQ95_DREPO|nr:hypothetical protein DPMN_078286 [Dreissena polymorpha]
MLSACLEKKKTNDVAEAHSTRTLSQELFSVPTLALKSPNKKSLSTFGTSVLRCEALRRIVSSLLLG